MAPRVTMADVARQAGVSMMTVSRVVNHKEGISDATRRRVQEIIDALGYLPSDIARGLVTARTGTIGLVVVDNANPFFSEVARGVEHVAHDEGYSVFLCNTEEDCGREWAVLRSLAEKRVDGVILCGSRLDDDILRTALERYPAAVLVNRRLDDSAASSLIIDDERGGRLVVEHLISSGHRALGLLAGPSHSFSGRQRAQGFRMALEEAGLVQNPSRERECLPMVDCGREAALDLLKQHSELTALFCFNDLVAFGALAACRDLGRGVPDDVAIVGYDDISFAALVTPALTTCRVPKYELGSMAMRLLLAHLRDHSVVATQVVLQPELVVRDSAP